MIARLRPLRSARTQGFRFRPTISLHAAMTDQNLFGKTFNKPSFWTWRTVAKLIDGIPLTEQREIDLFKQCTGRSSLPTNAVRTVILLAGRRGGKDRFFSAVACWRAALCCDWRRWMSEGEVAAIILVGADRKQAGVLKRYCLGLLETPLLAREVVRAVESSGLVEFRNGSQLEIVTNDAALVRGRSAVSVLGSETCFWRTDQESASSDEEVVAAAAPSLALCPDGGLLMLGSSVYRKRGFMHRKWKELFGKDDAEDLCWLAPSRVMNPVLPARVVAKALQDDPSRAKAEYLSEWRGDIESFISREAVEACVSAGIFERAPQAGIAYKAFVDPSGGSSDSFTLAVAHRDNSGSVILDCVRERRPPFMPTAVVQEFAQLLKSYRISSVQGDHYAGEWPREQFRRLGIQYEPSEKSKSNLYVEMLPSINAGTVGLVDNERLIAQLAGLERRTSRSGKDSIDHGPGAHDDVCNAVAGVVQLCAGKAPMIIPASALRWARMPRHLAGFARTLAHSTAATPQQALAMDSINASASDRHDASRGTPSPYPTSPEHVGSMSWSDTRERRS